MNNYDENKMINLSIINEFHLYTGIYIFIKLKNSVMSHKYAKKFHREKMSKRFFFNFVAVQK